MPLTWGVEDSNLRRRSQQIYRSHLTPPLNPIVNHNALLCRIMHIYIIILEICQVSYHALYSPKMPYRDLPCRKFGNFLARLFIFPNKKSALWKSANRFLVCLLKKYVFFFFLPLKLGMGLPSPATPGRGKAYKCQILKRTSFAVFFPFGMAVISSPKPKLSR